MDAARAAPCLGLAAPDVTLKANYSIPEIWAVEEDEARARAQASALREAGLRVVLTTGQALAAIPPHAPVQQVSVTEHGVDLLAEGQPVGLTWDTEFVGVYYTPRAGGPKEAPSRVVHEQGATCHAPFFDLYVPGGDVPKRYAALTDLTMFSRLGGPTTLSPAGLVAHFVQFCEERFTAGQVDRRLVNMQVRHWPGPAARRTSQVIRKGFSFASFGLAELLDQLGPDLVGLSHCEFASRLVYLTRRFGEDAGA